MQIFSRYERKRKQILIFSVFKIWSFSPYRLQIHFPCHCSFSYLSLWSICGIRNLSQQMSLQCLSTSNMVFSDEDKILIKSLYLKAIDRRISWKKAGQSLALISCWKSCGTQAQLSETQNAYTTTGSFQSHPHFTKENN